MFEISLFKDVMMRFKEFKFVCVLFEGSNILCLHTGHKELLSNHVTNESFLNI